MLMHGVSMRCDKNSTHTHTQNPKLLSSMGLLNPKQYNSHNTQINFELLLLLLLLLSLHSLSFVLLLIHSLTHRPFCSVLLGVSIGLSFSTSQTDYNVFSMRKRNDSCVHFCDFVKIFSRRWMNLGMCARTGKGTSEWTNERIKQFSWFWCHEWKIMTATVAPGQRCELEGIGGSEDDVTILRNFNWQMFFNMHLDREWEREREKARTKDRKRISFWCLQKENGRNSVSEYEWEWERKSTHARPEKLYAKNYARIHYNHFGTNLFTFFPIHFPSSWSYLSYPVRERARARFRSANPTAYTLYLSSV